MSLFQPLLILLPLGLDTLGVSLSLGIKSVSPPVSDGKGKSDSSSHWLRSAILFSLAEMLMPVVGLVIGYAASLIVSNIMHFVGALLLA
jgi:putative Mn2+ efflux pump MntP